MHWYHDTRIRFSSNWILWQSKQLCTDQAFLQVQALSCDCWYNPRSFWNVYLVTLAYTYTDKRKMFQLKPRSNINMLWMIYVCVLPWDSIYSSCKLNTTQYRLGLCFAHKCWCWHWGRAWASLLWGGDTRVTRTRPVAPWTSSPSHHHNQDLRPGEQPVTIFRV